VKKQLFILALFTHSLLQASEFGTIVMSVTLFILLITLIIALMAYLKRVQRENVKNSALFDYSDVPTLFINAKGNIVDLNRSAQTLLGYSKKQLASQQWYEKLLPDESSIQIRHQIHQHLKTDGHTTFNSHLVRADGQLLEVNYTLSALPEPIKGSVLTLIDVTARNASMHHNGTLSEKRERV